jgi:outer membrane lipoprotein carrier protein
MTSLLLVALLLAPPAAPADAGPAALRAAAAKYGDGAAHAAAFEQTYTPAGFSNARREKGTVWIQAPEQLRFEYSEPDRKTFTYDGREGRFYSPADRQLNVRKLSPEERARLPIVFLTDPSDLARRYEITSEAAADGAQRLVLLPRDPRPELARLELTVASDGTIRGLSYADDAGNKTDFRFDTWRSEKARPAEDYRVTGPKGTRVIE